MRKWLPLAAVCLGTFMLLLDVTIVNVALPPIAADLGTSFASLQWVVDSYALALAALVLGIGSVADIVGRQRVYLGGLVLFAVASAACGAAPNAAALVAARAVQGIGGAAMFATTVALLNSAYRGRDRGTAFGLWGAVSGAGSAAGPIAGGLLTDGLSWRWIFYVNLPISVVAIALTVAYVRDDEHRPARVDLPGILTFTAAAGALTYGMIEAGEAGWGAARTLVPLAVGALALVAFVLVERRRGEPMLDLGLFRSASFSGTMVGAGLLTFGAFAYLAYTSLWLQFGLGMTPLHAGLVFVPLSVAAFLVSAVAGRVLHGMNPRWPIGFGLVLIGVGALLQSGLDAGSTWRHLVLGLVVAGVGVGLATPTLVGAAMSAVPTHRGGMAAGAVNTSRQLGLAFGIAVLGTLLRQRLDGPGGPATASPAAFADGLNVVLVVSGVVSLVAAAVVLFTVRPAGTAGVAPPAPRDGQEAGPAVTPAGGVRQ